MTRIKTLLAGAACACAMLSMAGGANAAITATSSGAENYSQDVSAYPAGVVCDFEAACTGGFTMTSAGGAGILQGSSNLGAAPPGDATHYMSIVGGGTSTLTAATGMLITGLSIFMGSPDAYNSVSFLNGATVVQTLTGAQFNGVATNGDQTLGQRIAFNFGGASVTGVQFNSSSSSFEFDRVIATVAAVPEAATWGMMILGLGMVGMGLRLRRRTAGAVA